MGLVVVICVWCWLCFGGFQACSVVVMQFVFCRVCRDGVWLLVDDGFGWWSVPVCSLVLCRFTCFVVVFSVA